MRLGCAISPPTEHTSSHQAHAHLHNGAWDMRLRLFWRSLCLRKHHMLVGSDAHNQRFLLTHATLRTCTKSAPMLHPILCPPPLVPYPPLHPPFLPCFHSDALRCCSGGSSGNNPRNNPRGSALSRCSMLLGASQDLSGSSGTMNPLSQTLMTQAAFSVQRRLASPAGEMPEQALQCTWPPLNL